MTDDRALREIPLSEKRVFDGIIVNVDHMTVRLPNGNEASREIVRHVGGIAIVPIDDEGYVYMVRQHRIAIDEMTLEIPAGKRDSAEEDIRLGAIRELEEETGLRAESLELMTNAVSTPGFCTERLAIFLATGLTRHQAHPDADEFLGVERIPFAEALSRVMSGELSDAKTALGILMAARRLNL